MRMYLREHDLRTALQREAPHSGADRGQGQRVQLVLTGQLERAPGTGAQALLAHAAAGLHAGGVDHAASRQLTGSRERSSAQRYGTVGIALGLDCRPAALADRACHARAQQQLRVGGVYDRVDLRIAEVPFLDQDPSHQGRVTVAATASKRSGMIAPNASVRAHNSPCRLCFLPRGLLGAAAVVPAGRDRRGP